MSSMDDRADVCRAKWVPASYILSGGGGNNAYLYKLLRACKSLKGKNVPVSVSKMPFQAVSFGAVARLDVNSRIKIASYLTRDIYLCMREDDTKPMIQHCIASQGSALPLTVSEKLELPIASEIDVCLVEKYEDDEDLKGLQTIGRYASHLLDVIPDRHAE